MLFASVRFLSGRSQTSSAVTRELLEYRHKGKTAPWDERPSEGSRRFVLGAVELVIRGRKSSVGVLHFRVSPQLTHGGTDDRNGRNDRSDRSHQLGHLRSPVVDSGRVAGWQVCLGGSATYITACLAGDLISLP